MFSEGFLIEIKLLALRIAKRQRNEDHLQDAKILARKFNRELVELDEAAEPWDELPDIAYYAACLAIQGALEALPLVAYQIQKYDVSPAQLEAGTLAKYRLRAAQEKNIEVERAAILDAVGRVK